MSGDVSGMIASQTGAASGLWTHTPVDWRGNETVAAQPGGWPAQAKDGVFPNGSTSVAVAPTLSAISVSAITATGATINYTVNPAASSQVEFGTTTAYGTVRPVSANTGAGAKTAALTGLLVTATLYHYRVFATSTAGGLVTYSADATFTTA